MRVPRGRPSAERAAQLDRTILDAAFAGFLDHGYQATAMEGVARQAGVSKSTLYGRFPTKEALLRACLTDRAGQWSRAASTRNHLIPDSFDGMLRHHGQTVITMFAQTELSRVTRLIESIAVDFPDVSRFWHETAMKPYVAYVAENMRKRAADAPPDVDWEFLSGLFMHGLGGWLRSEAMAGPVSPEQAEAHLDKLVRSIEALVR